ncbi:hypothetical protein HY091_01805 [Candidatus Kaiserbacteria bacterium]|nr:hypothetical protein [Candidatus Kaiserbacteria bacterium]
MRRTLIIIATVVVLAGVGAWVYFSFFAGSAGVAVAPAGNAGLPIAGQGTQNGSAPSGATAGAPSAPAAPVKVSPRLVQIDKGPVVPGEVARDIKISSTTNDVVVSYVERQSGNVFSYFVNAGTLTRTSNRTLPGIEEASWLPDASLAFVRYLSGTNFSITNTYALRADGSSGFFLPQNLAGVSVSSTTILALASGGNGSVVSLVKSDGTRATQVFTTPLSSIRISFAGKNQYLVVTKPSATLPGDAYLVDSAGHFSRVAGPLSGLVALASPSGTWALVSSAANGTMRLELVNALTGSALPLPVATIADKCAWALDESAVYCGVPISPSAAYSYPDDWYQGAAHFSDRIWKIEVTGRYAELVLDFNKETKGLLDAEALALDPQRSALAFLNKNDGSLWSYQL